MAEPELEFDPTTAKQCPECHASWVGQGIPKKQQENYGGATHFRKTIAIYDQDRDRTTGWMCPKCLIIFKR